MDQAVYLVCSASDVDSVSGACANPVWLPVQFLLPPMDAGTGIAIGLGILACWALAYGISVMQRVGE